MSCQSTVQVSQLSGQSSIRSVKCPVGHMTGQSIVQVSQLSTSVNCPAPHIPIAGAGSKIFWKVQLEMFENMFQKIGSVQKNVLVLLSGLLLHWHCIARLAALRAIRFVLAP